MGKGKLKEALQLAGSEHRYQKTLIVLLMFAWISMVFVFLSSPYIYMDPIFHCQSRGQGIAHQRYACKNQDECTLINNFTIVGEIQLYCARSWARTVIQSIFPLGSFIGLLITNLISDTRGRKQAFLLSLFIQIVSILFTLYGVHAVDIFYLIIAQFLGGWGSYSIMPLAYTLAADFLSDRMRPKAVVILNASGGVATISLGIFALIQLNWHYFIVFFQLVPFVCLFIAFYFFLQQTPYILMNHNQVQHAEQVFIKIAKFNGRQQNIPQIKRIIEDQQQRHHTKMPSLGNVFRTIRQWKFLHMIIVLTGINIVANLYYFGMSYSFAQQGLGYGFNNIVFGFVQIFSIVFLTYAASNFPRKTGIPIFYAGAMFFGLLYFTQFVKSSLLISTVLIGFSRTCAIIAYCLLACMETEAFVVSIQSTAAGLIQGLGIIGGIIAPFIVQLAEVMEVDPIALCAVFVCCAIWPAYFLRETFHVPPIIIDSSKSLTQQLLSKNQLEMQNQQNNEDQQRPSLEKQLQVRTTSDTKKKEEQKF